MHLRRLMNKNKDRSDPVEMNRLTNDGWKMFKEGNDQFEKNKQANRQGGRALCLDPNVAEFATAAAMPVIPQADAKQMYQQSREEFLLTLQKNRIDNGVMSTYDKDTFHKHERKTPKQAMKESHQRYADTYDEYITNYRTEFMKNPKKGTVGRPTSRVATGSGRVDRPAGPPKISQQDFLSQAQLNLKASRKQYQDQLHRMRHGTSVYAIDAAELAKMGAISDEKKLSPLEYKKVATDNFLDSKQAYKNQMIKSVNATSDSPLKQGAIKFEVGKAISDEKKLSPEEFARVATENFLDSKRAYKNQMKKSVNAAADSPLKASY